MANEAQGMHESEEGQSTAQLVHKTMHFLVALRYRKSVVLGTMAIALLLAGLYFATATRYYGATAGLLIMQSGVEKLSTSMADGGVQQQGLMPTFENLIRSARVIEEALKTIPAQHRIDFAGLPEGQWVTAVQKNLSAKALRQTNILEMHYTSRDPHTAVVVLNAILQAYVNFIDSTHKGNASEIIRVLTKEQADLSMKLANKEQELLAARCQSGDLGIREGSKVIHPVVQRAISLNEKLIDTQKQRIEVEASLAAIQMAVANGEDLRQHLIRVAEAVGREVLLHSLGMNGQNAWVQAYLERDLLDARASLKTLDEYLGPAHREYVGKLEKVRITEQYLAEEQQRARSQMAGLQCNQLGPLLVHMVQQRLLEIQALETSLQVQFDRACCDAVALNGQVSRVEILEHDLRWLRNLHDVLLNQIASVDLKQDSHEIQAAVVNEPKPILRPVSPNLLRVLLGAMALGVCVALVAVYVLDVLDDRFRSVDELQEQMGAPVLALVRQFESRDTVGLDALQMHVAPMAGESESFRTLRTALALAETQPRQIVVTSAEPGDGKTTILANLGVCFAQAGKKTLLIDADLRRPGLTNLLGLRACRGLSTVISSEEDVGELASQTTLSSGIAGLDVMPSGLRPANPAELLASGRFLEMLSWAETVYDQILIDSPPILATSDAALLGRQVDGVVLVVQADKNRRRGLLRVAERLGLLKIPLLGVVINRTGSERDRGYYGYQGYGYGESYSYGSGDRAEEEEQGSPLQVERGAGLRSFDDEPVALIVPRKVA